MKYIAGIHIPGYELSDGVRVFFAVKQEHPYISQIHVGDCFMWDEGWDDKYADDYDKRLWAVWHHPPTQEEIQQVLVEHRLMGF